MERFTKYNPMWKEYQLIDEQQTSFEAKQRLGVIEDLIEENNIENLDELKSLFKEFQMEKEETQKWYDLLVKIDTKDHKIAVLERALELAVADKCKYENLMIEGIVGKGAKVAVPKKEQWYKEQAESDIKNDKE